MALEGTVTRARVIPHSIQRINPHGVHHKWWLAAAVTLSGFLSTMSQTSVQVALPQIMTVYGLNVDQVQTILIRGKVTTIKQQVCLSRK